MIHACHSPKTSLPCLTATLLGLAFVACVEPEPTTPDEPGIAAAKSGGTSSSSGGSSDLTVQSVDPDSATRDTTLDIVVSGSGFSQGSRVDLGQGGVTSDQIRTNSTTFVNSRKLTANITISATADTGKYDVIVMALDGRKGIGIELFTVQGTPNAQDLPVSALFTDRPGDRATNDLVDQPYVNGQEGVTAVLDFNFSDPYGRLGLEPPDREQRHSVTRKLCLDLTEDPGVHVVDRATFALAGTGCLLNNELLTATRGGSDNAFANLEPGTFDFQGGRFLWVDGTYNWFLSFDEQNMPLCQGQTADDGTLIDAGNAVGRGFRITRLADSAGVRRWTVEPEPDSNGHLSAELSKMILKGSGARTCIARFDNIPFKLTVTELK